MPILYIGRKRVTNKASTIRKNEHKYHKHQKNFKIGNGISIGIIVSLLLLFSTLSAFHIERSYAQSLAQRTGTFHIPSPVLVQSLPYSIYATMIAEDNTDLSWPIRDVSILSF
jgi:hypothetical protein